MMVFCMFSDGSWDRAFVSTPSAGHGNINRITCAYVTGYEILLQDLVTFFYFINRPGVAGAVLQIPLSLIN